MGILGICRKEPEQTVSGKRMMQPEDPAHTSLKEETVG